MDSAAKKSATGVDPVSFEGPLLPDGAARERWERQVRQAGTKSRLDINGRLPMVSIGKPVITPVADLLGPGKMPAMLQTQLAELDFYLVRLACSFRPRYKEITIEQAIFTVFLLSRSSHDVPTAYDLHPRDVKQEIKRDAKFVLSPSLKFLEAEVSLGQVLVPLEQTELLPVIAASGVGENCPSWEYRQTKNFPLTGSKLMWILLETHKGVRPVTATTEITAKVNAYGGLLDTFIGLDKEDQEVQSHLTWKLVG